MSCGVPDRKRAGYRGILCLESVPVEFIELIKISEACAASERGKKKNQASLFSVLFFWAGWLIHASFEIKIHMQITQDSHSWHEDLSGRLYTSSVVAHDESLDVWGYISFRTMNSTHWEF